MFTHIYIYIYIYIYVIHVIHIYIYIYIHTHIYMLHTNSAIYLFSFKGTKDLRHDKITDFCPHTTKSLSYAHTQHCHDKFRPHNFAHTRQNHWTFFTHDNIYWLLSRNLRNALLTHRTIERTNFHLKFISLPELGFHIPWAQVTAFAQKNWGTYCIRHV
jgi:hypothetical protein